MSGRSRQVSLSALAAKTALPDVAEGPPPSTATAPLLTDDTAQPASVQPEPAALEEPPRAPSPRATRRRTASTRPAPGEWARYDEYERKEARLRPDQYGRLSTTSRALNRARRGQGERITENTLIRVAIDLLLARDQEITGTTEAEIRRSLGL